jgi:surfeit locus 1 family protein
MKPSKSFLFFSLFLILVFISLGTWQLYRKQEKEALIYALERSQRILPQNVDEVQTPFLFQPLSATGHFVSGKTIFLQAKTYQGKNGVYVLDVFQTQHGQYLLVQRGWSAHTKVIVPIETLKIEGITRLPSPPTYFQPANKPPQYFWIDLNQLSTEFNLPLLPYYLVVKESFDPQILTTDPIPFPVNNHLQYAITWYLLAFFLVSMLLWSRVYSLKKENK